MTQTEKYIWLLNVIHQSRDLKDRILLKEIPSGRDGLTRADTDQTPTFPQVWAQVEDQIKGLPLVAHNKPFDEACLKAVFDEYGMKYPGYEFHCTPAASRRTLKLPSHQLHIVVEACGFDLLNHHNALADAEACAAIALKLL